MRRDLDHRPGPVTILLILPLTLVIICVLIAWTKVAGNDQQVEQLEDQLNQCRQYADPDAHPMSWSYEGEASDE